MGIFESKQDKNQWRVNSTINWTKEGLEQMRKDIKIAAKPKGKEEMLTLLVFGPTGCGKSSFCNGLKTAITGAPLVQKYFGVGSADGSFTQGFLGWKWENIAVVDMAGVCEDPDIADEDVKKILLGQVPITATLTSELAPSEVQQVKHSFNCVILVLRAGMELPENTARLLKMANELGRHNHFAYHLVLTHLDLVDEKYHVPRKLVDVLESREVQRKVIKMQEETKIPLNSISIVRNYVGETHSDLHCNVLLLDTMQQIISTAVEEAEKRAQKFAF